MGRRGQRYSDLLAEEMLAKSVCSVIGVGAIGRQVALSLAVMGVGELRLFDPDVVEEVNLGTQGWEEADLGCAKIEATAKKIDKIDSSCVVVSRQMTVDARPLPAGHEAEVEGAVFVCVDSMQARRGIWRFLANRNWQMLVDARMGAEVLQVHTLKRRQEAKFPVYEATLQDAGVTREPCTRRATFYCANVAAGIAVAEWTKMCRGHEGHPAGLRLSLLESNVEWFTEGYWLEAESAQG